MKLVLILIAVTIVFIFTKTRPLEDKKCIDQNVWQDLYDSTKLIGDPTKCTKISTDCCFISINYSYLSHKIESEYCASLSGKIEDFKKFVENTYMDDITYYSTSSYNNYNIFKKIGRQLSTKYYENMGSCSQPSDNPKDYSTYLEQNCGKFDPETGDCLEEKDTKYFEGFVADFYEYFLLTYCNKKDEDGKCILYTGTQQNNAMVKPLLRDLIGYLHLDNPDYEGDDTNVDTNKDIREKWPNKTDCTPRSPVNVIVICPENYVKCEWIYFSYSFFIFIFVIILYS